MLFSSKYTKYTVIPRAIQAGRPQEMDLTLTLTVALMTDWHGVGQAKADKIISQALNTHAGGRRVFRHTPVFIKWILVWGHPGHHHSNALAVSFLPKDVLASAGEGGFFALEKHGGGQNIAGLYLDADDLSMAVKRPHGSTAELFRRTASHELGHAEALDDDRDNKKSIMYFRQLNRHQIRRISQRWTDTELRTALQGLFDPKYLPPWLHS